MKRREILVINGAVYDSPNYMEAEWKSAKNDSFSFWRILHVNMLKMANFF